MVAITSALMGGIAAGKMAYDWWQNKKNRDGLASKLSVRYGNRIKGAIDKHVGNNFIGDTLHALNETVFDPSNHTKDSHPPDTVNGAQKQVSYNSSNASYSGGEGALYGTKPGARNPYDYASNDFENIIRKQQFGNRLPKAHRYRMW